MIAVLLVAVTVGWRRRPDRLIMPADYDIVDRVDLA
jgi:hypothetical protein